MNTLKTQSKFRLPEAIKTKLDSHEYRAGLIRQGYRLVGQGTFAAVYSKPKASTVIKMGNVNGDSYLRYVERVGLMSANVHFPKIHSVVIYDTAPNDPFSCPYYVVEMEKLQSINQAARSAKLDAYTEYGRIKQRLGIHDVADLNEEWVENVFTQDTNFGELVITLKNLYNTGARSDIKETNVMYRVAANRQIDLVVTDPVV